MMKEAKQRRSLFGSRSRKPLKKTAVIWLMAAALLLSITGLSGCASAKLPEQDDGRLQIVTTIFPPYDFARAIGGDKVNVTMLLSPGEEVHSYEPTPLDIRKIRQCGLFLYVGGENDVWVERILDNMGEDRPQALRLVDLTDILEEEIVEGMMEERGGHDHEGHDHEGHDHEDHDHEEAETHDHEDHDHEEADVHGHGEHAHSGDSSEEEHEEADEHVWTSPVKAAEIILAIADKMEELDPDNAESYKTNAGAYVEQILDLDAQYREIVENAECSSESEPSASTLAFLIDKVREEQIPVVFSIEFSNGNIARAICESTGAVRRTFWSCHNVTKEQMESGATYVSLMTENLVAVREALGERNAEK